MFLGMGGILLLLVLCAIAHSHPNRISTVHDDPKGSDLPPFIVQWANSKSDGYRIATFADFTSSFFAQQYNLNNGFPYSFDTGSGQACGLSVKEGYLKFPKNDTANADDVTVYSKGAVSCALLDAPDNNGYVATMQTQGCGKYNGKVFFSPVSETFFADNFYTVTSTCEFTQEYVSFALFVLISAAPTPSPTPSLRPTPTPTFIRPTPTPIFRTPTPTPSTASYLCCGYYDFLEHFESDFCQLAGKVCPDIDGYTSVGNYTASSCDECCGAERKLFIQN